MTITTSSNDSLPDSGGPRQAGRSDPPGQQEVLDQLGRITGSNEFQASKRSADFLEFVVNQILEGREIEISQHAIADAVFGRGADFDPAIDPIVRIQAGRVRRSLKHYYFTEGARDPVVIGLPRGAYLPVFTYSRGSAPETRPLSRSNPAVLSSWPTLLVAPLVNLTGQPEVDFIAKGLASDLAVEFSRDNSLLVFLAPGRDTDPRNTRSPRFELTGTVDRRADDYKINLHLVDTNSSRQTWAQTFFCTAGPDQGNEFDKLVQRTVSMIAEEHGILSNQITRESLHHPNVAASSYEAILRHHHFELTHEPQAFAEALSALRKAVETDPSCALCWSYLARLCGTHWALGLPGPVTPFEEILAAARRGVELAPLDIRTHAILGFIHLLADQIELARSEADAALDLCGNSIFWHDGIGWLLTLAGDWEHGPQLVRQALEVNPFPRGACYGALWLDALRRNDPLTALSAAQEHAPESYFWAPLMEAVALVENNQVDEAGQCVRDLLQLKPDFPEKGHWLITRYVKVDHLVGRIEDALGEAGLAM